MLNYDIIIQRRQTQSNYTDHKRKSHRRRLAKPDNRQILSVVHWMATTGKQFKYQRPIIHVHM